MKFQGLQDAVMLHDPQPKFKAVLLGFKQCRTVSTIVSYRPLPASIGPSNGNRSLCTYSCFVSRVLSDHYADPSAFSTPETDGYPKEED